MMADDDEGAFLRLLGERVRELRTRRSMTRRGLASESGVSERYLAQLEGGQGNASVLVIRSLAQAFGVPPEALVASRHTTSETTDVIATIGSLLPDQLRAVQHFINSISTAGNHTMRGQRIALIGLRGGGKTTLGTLIAKELDIPFVDLDREIERDAGASFSTICELFGEAGYHRYERACLERLLDTEPRFVLATGSSIVSEALTFERLLAACYTVWVSTSPDEHISRIIPEREIRPYGSNRDATSQIKRLLAGREPLYRRADVEVSTAGKSIDESLAALRSALLDEIQ